MRLFAAANDHYIHGFANRRSSNDRRQSAKVGDLLTIKPHNDIARKNSGHLSRSALGNLGHQRPSWGWLHTQGVSEVGGDLL